MGTVKRRYAYDPWGKRRDADNWNIADNGANLIINRGYTGHEHLDAFGIINMNGRVYDPYTAQFFSPDPYIQAPGDWLNYNRYGYCMGNPFKYTDPSGFSWFSRHWKSIITAVAAIGVGIGVGVLTGGMGLVAAGMFGGSAGGFTSGALGTALNGGSFNQVLNSGIQGAVIGGATGALTGGFNLVGDAFGHAVGSFGNELLRAGAHGVLSGSINAIGGGNFLEGFAVGSISSFAASGLQALGVDPLVGILGTSAVGAGTAALMGGNPINGGLLGLAIGALNHWVPMPDGTLAWEPGEVTIVGKRTILGKTLEWWRRSSGAINQVNIEFDLIFSARLAYNAFSTASKTVYRAFGGDSRAEGFSWTPKDPRTISDFRNLAGLPSGGESGATNTAEFLIEGKVNPYNIITKRPALQLDGNVGGLLEYKINPANINITNFWVIKP